MAEYTASIEIDARPDEVFDFLVTEDGMTAWMGQHAELDPSIGGAFAGASPAEMGKGRRMGPGWVAVAAEALANDGLSFWIGVALEYNATTAR